MFFNVRYLPHTESDISEMLKVVGASSLDGLFSSIPARLRFKGALNLPPPLSEPEILRHLERDAAKYISFLGAGSYRHFVPSALKTLVSRSEFVTPYTPYQPEISQGTLKLIFEYQTMIARLFEMDVANASHYDGSSAAAEAALLAMRATGRKGILVASTLHPEYRQVIKTVIAPLCFPLPSGERVKGEGRIDLVPHLRDGTTDRDSLKNLCNSETAAVIVQYPNFFGVVEELGPIAELAHNIGALLIVVVTEPISMGLLEPPGALGADVVVGEGQAFGCGLFFGGPNLGIFTAKEKYLRLMPGRIVGETVDAEGRTGYVLTLATREQHIRRQRATSNICTNEALCAAAAAIYLSLLGKEGLVKLAELNYAKAEYAKDRIKNLGLRIKFQGATFNEFVVDVGRPADEALTGLAKQGIFGGVALGRWYPELKNCMLVCVTEENGKGEIDKLVALI